MGPDHVLADLGYRMGDEHGGQVEGYQPVAANVVDAGLLAILADITGGRLAYAARAPCGMSTYEITVIGLPGTHEAGNLQCAGRLVSVGRTRVATEVEFTIPGAAPALALAEFRIFPESTIPETERFKNAVETPTEPAVMTERLRPMTVIS